MIDTDVIRSIMGATVYDASGDKIGKVGQVYVDTDSGRPVWASVNTGLFGTAESFVPLRDASWDGERLQVGYEKSFVTDAPRIDVDGALSTEDQQELYRYYAAESAASDDSGYDGGDYDRPDYDRSDRDDRERTDDRRPEYETGGTRTAEAGHVRFRKYVVTEEQTITVPVTREEVRVEWESDSDANAGDDRGNLSDRTDRPDGR